MSNPTNPFNWQMPTAVDLVTDLPADFEVFGQAVATSMADLLGGTTGQILSKNSNTDMDFVWTSPNPGDITGITATSPLTGGGTSGDVTVGIQAASTSQSGAVQLTDSTSSTSTTTAATPNAVKTSYDLAAAAIPKSTVTTNGDLIYGTGSGTVARLGVGSTGQVLTVTGGVPAWATASGGSNTFYAGKNKIINGNFGIWQRGTSISLTNNTTAYTTDRWYVYTSFSAGSSTLSQQTFTPGTAPVSGYEGTNFARFTAGSTATYFEFGQRIEDVRVLAGQTATISFWAKASANTTVSSTLLQNFGSGGSSQVSVTGASHSVTTSWQRFNVSVSVPSLSGKTIGTASYLALTLAANSLTGSQTIDIWGTQLEAGSSATDFVTASGNSPQAELAMCQRYYYRQTGSNYSSYGQGAAFSGTSAWILVQHPVTMRKAPTVIEYSTLCMEYYGISSSAITALSIDSGANNPTVSLLVADVASGLTQYRPYRLANNANSSGYFAVNAEL